MRRIIFFSALIIAGTIGLAIILLAIFAFGVANFVVTFFAVILIIMIIVGIIGGALALDDHDRRC